MERKLPSMRRKDREMDEKWARESLDRGAYGVLASVGEDGRPYGVPLSYIMMDGALYFHCATRGRKLDNIRFNPNVTFSVVEDVLPFFNEEQNNYSTTYESAFVEGEAKEVADDDEKNRVLIALVQKYSPENLDRAPISIAKSGKATLVVRIDIARTTGKKRLMEK